jgi:hypothetical protein
MPFDGVGFASDDQVISLLATPDKWCKGQFNTPDGRYCIRGAIMGRVVGRSRVRLKRTLEARVFLRQFRGKAELFAELLELILHPLWSAVKGSGFQGRPRSTAAPFVCRNTPYAAAMPRIAA